MKPYFLKPVVVALLLVAVAAGSATLGVIVGGKFARPAPLPALSVEGLPPVDGSWHKLAVPVLSPTRPWEENALEEPNVWFEQGRWHMIYTGGWDHPALGHAISHDGIHWKKYFQNPILGQGRGGWAGAAHCSSLWRENGMIYVYYMAELGTGKPGTGDLHLAEGKSYLTLRAVPICPLLHTVAARSIANTCVWKSGNTYRMLFDSDVPTPDHWEEGYAEADRPEGPFHIVAFPLRTLQGPLGAIGACSVIETNGLVECYFLGSTDKAACVPTDLYRSYSKDCIHWSPAQHIMTREKQFEYDQVADPFITPDDRRLYYSAMDNIEPSGYICLATR